jgi:hypothetical protein
MSSGSTANRIGDSRENTLFALTALLAVGVHYFVKGHAFALCLSWKAGSLVASIIYSDRRNRHHGCLCGETEMPHGSQREYYNQNYGRQIPEIEPEEIQSETGQGEQR